MRRGDEGEMKGEVEVRYRREGGDEEKGWHG